MKGNVIKEEEQIEKRVNSLYNGTPVLFTLLIHILGDFLAIIFMARLV